MATIYCRFDHARADVAVGKKAHALSLRGGVVGLPTHAAAAAAAAGLLWGRVCTAAAGTGSLNPAAMCKTAAVAAAAAAQFDAVLHRDASASIVDAALAVAAGASFAPGVSSAPGLAKTGARLAGVALFAAADAAALDGAACAASKGGALVPSGRLLQLLVLAAHHAFHLLLHLHLRLSWPLPAWNVHAESPTLTNRQH